MRPPRDRQQRGAGRVPRRPAARAARSRRATRTRSRDGCSSSPPRPVETRGQVGAELRRRVVEGHSVDSWADAVTAAVPRRAVSSGGGDRSPPSRRLVRPRARRAGPRGRSSSPAAPPRTLVRRVLAIATLAALDAGGLALGLYIALVLRSSSSATRSSGACSGARPGEWLPFLIPITLLVFWQAGLYARARAARGLGPRRLVARARRGDHARVRLGNGLRLHDLRADPDRVRHVRARDRAAARGLRLGHARAAAACCTSGAACCSSAEGEQLAALQRLLASQRRDVAYEFVGAFAPAPRRLAGARGSRARGRTS